MPKYTRRDFQLGEYWIGNAPKSPAWHRCWYDNASRQTKRVSLGTTDLEEAKRKLTEWYIANREAKQEKPQEVLLAEVCARYYEHHGKHLRTHKNTKAGLAMWTDHFGAATVSELTVNAQKAFHAKLLATMKPASVQRIVTMGKAALNRAYKHGEIASVPYVLPVKVGNAPPKGRPLEVEELQALYRALPSHVQTFMLWALGTAARPEALFELHSSQVDWRRRLVDLNPPGRTQTKKYRPVVRVPKALGEFSGHLVVFRRKRVKSVKTAWREAVKQAGLTGAVTPYSLRKTAAMFMMREGVSPDEVAMQLGHRRLGITGIYVEYSPDYLPKAVKALDKLVLLTDDRLKKEKPCSQPKRRGSHVTSSAKMAK